MGHYFAQRVPKLPEQNLSFEKQILNSFSTLLYDAGTTQCSATRDGLASIINSLARYEEEGNRLYPKILFTEDLKALKLLLPQCEILHIGEGPLRSESYQKGLKRCAPLALGGWYVFIERSSTTVDYGLIRSGSSALSELPEQLILESNADTGPKPTIVIRQIAEGSVSVTTSNGHLLNVTFTGRELQEADRRPKLGRLIDRICQHIGSEISPKLKILLNKLFARITEHGHGTLIIVVEATDFAVDDSLKDGNWLREPIELGMKVQAELQSHGDGEATASTNAAIEAVTGMLMSDGITVFNNMGQLVGFNLFVKPSAAEDRQLNEAGVGGARRRAFELLKLRLGHPIVACLMVSHDGLTAYEQVGDENDG